MPRPTTKQQLLQQNHQHFNQLLTLVNQTPSKHLQLPGANEHWSVKDLLTHLHAWHQLFFTWHDQGMNNQQPQIPAPGYTWKTTPELNQKIYLNHKNKPLKIVLKSLNQSHHKITKLITTYSQDQLFTKKKYTWTGSTSLASYLISATTSHYQWAIKHIKKYQKTLKNDT